MNDSAQPVPSATRIALNSTAAGAVRDALAHDRTHLARVRPFAARLRTGLVAALCLLVLDTSAATAQDYRVTVRVDGRPVLRLGPADSSTAAERARRVERRTATLLETSRALAPARLAPAGVGSRDRVIAVAGVAVVTVTGADAEDNVTSPDALAAQWARALDAALARATERRGSRVARFGADVQASVEAAFSRLAESAISIIPRVLAAMLVLVPNSERFTARVTNNTESPVRRAIVPLYLGYDIDLRRAVEVVRAAAAGTEGVQADPPVAVRIAELGADDLVFEARFWTDSRRADFTATQAAVRATVVDGLRVAGIGLPNPDVRILR